MSYARNQRRKSANLSSKAQKKRLEDTVVRVYRDRMNELYKREHPEATDELSMQDARQQVRANGLVEATMLRMQEEGATVTVSD